MGVDRRGERREAGKDHIERLGYTLKGLDYTYYTKRRIYTARVTTAWPFGRHPQLSSNSIASLPILVHPTPTLENKLQGRLTTDSIVSSCSVIDDTLAPSATFALSVVGIFKCPPLDVIRRERERENGSVNNKETKRDVL